MQKFMDKKTQGFTLAEVLITLGIIGVVAALTLPILIQKYRNNEVEAKLKKVYSTMNQAIQLSELDNGPKEFWPAACDIEDESSENYCKNYYKKYILPYLKYSKIQEFESFRGYNLAIYLLDGSLLVTKEGYDYNFFPNAKNFDISTYAQMDENGKIIGREGNGKTYFSFRFFPSSKNDIHAHKGFEPYAFHLTELSKESLTTIDAKYPYACNKEGKFNGYCTALIQINGWKIPKDYPFKVK